LLDLDFRSLAIRSGRFRNHGFDPGDDEGDEGEEEEEDMLLR
jgi:hypothetical protein